MPFSQWGPSTDVGEVSDNISSSVIKVQEGDYFEVRARQRSGGALDVNADGRRRTWFALEVIE